jgi:hypothetical protein
MKQRIYVVFVLALLAVLLFATQLSVTNAQTFAEASSSGWGASAAYSQTMGWATFSQAATFGNGQATAAAFTPYGGWGSVTNVVTSGYGAAFANAVSNPWGSASYVQTGAFGWGTAYGFAQGN